MGWAVAVHGGAGLIRRASLTAEREAACTAGLHAALQASESILRRGGSALDASVAAVVVLEEDPHFNAGRGAVLAGNGTAELDAAVMEGHHRRAGAVTGMRTTRNPILAARWVLEHSPHVLMVDIDDLAAAAGLAQVDNSWFVVPERRLQLQRALASGGFHLDHGGEAPDVYGTVGAVCCDANGHVAAATSTGGMVNKLPGRIGDSPVVGAGTYAADGSCAVSATGHGEPILRLALAARVAAWMDIGGRSVTEAADIVVHSELAALDGLGGCIAVDATGRVALPFNSAGMFRGWWCQGDTTQVAIW